MSAKNLTLRRFVTGIVCMLLVGLFGVMPAAAEDATGVAPGTSLTAGNIYVWEDASAWPTSHLYFGYSDGSFVVDELGHNAWAPYDTTDAARDGACSTAAARLTADGGGFTSVTVNDVAYDANTCSSLDVFGSAPEGSASTDSGSGGNSGNLEDSMKLTPNTDTQEGTAEQPMVMDPGTYDPATLAENGIECMSAESAAAQQQASGSGTASIYDNDAVTELPNGGVAIPTGLAVPAGICVNDGIIVVRAVYTYGVGGVEDVFAMDLDPSKGGVYCGKHGETGYDCWWNYPTTDAAVYASCEVAQGDQEAATVEGNYIYQGAQVTYFGGPVPTVCR